MASLFLSALYDKCETEYFNGVFYAVKVQYFVVVFLCFEEPIHIALVFFLLRRKPDMLPKLPHPRRPRGSQSDREKGRDESFQVRAKKPLGTDSHRAISKTSSGCRLLIGHKKCFVLLCPIGKQFLLSSFREFVEPHTHRIWSTSFCLIVT